MGLERWGLIPADEIKEMQSLCQSIVFKRVAKTMGFLNVFFLAFLGGCLVLRDLFHIETISGLRFGFGF